MATMIPSAISPDVKSNAERHIYEWFENAKGTEDWIILHSLGIVNHNKYIHGEVDFFVMVPNLGIFAIEVKGGRVKRKEGIWSFTDRYGHTDKRVKGPFDQAWDGIYSIRQSLSNKLDDNHKYLEKIFFGIGVMFPDIPYDSVGIDEEQWQVFDCNDGKNVRAFVERVAEGSKTGWRTQYGELTSTNRPTVDDIRYLASILRGDFDKALSLRVQYNYAEEEMVRLTANQYKCIDQLEDNPRCLIKGSAGTGKTLLAIEEVKKYVSRGEKVALLCYNSLLANWLQYYFSRQSEALHPVYVGTLHGYLMKIVQQKHIRVAFPDSVEKMNQFFAKELPAIVSDVFKSEGGVFDRVIIDEAQDLMSEEYLICIDTMLKKGIARGKWDFFGDFNKQAIYTKDMVESDFMDMLEERTSYIRYKLTTNCRNTQYICDQIKIVTGFTKDAQYESMIQGNPVDYRPYKSKEDELKELLKVLEELSNNGVENGRITILSPYKRNKSVVNLLRGIRVEDYTIPAPEEITFSTIQGFKGLENTVIILTDIESYEDIKLAYVAFSRARSGLYVLHSQTAHDEYNQICIRRLFLNG